MPSHPYPIPICCPLSAVTRHEGFSMLEMNKVIWLWPHLKAKVSSFECPHWTGWKGFKTPDLSPRAVCLLTVWHSEADSIGQSSPEGIQCYLIVQKKSNVWRIKTELKREDQTLPYLRTLIHLVSHYIKWAWLALVFRKGTKVVGHSPHPFLTSKRGFQTLSGVQTSS